MRPPKVIAILVALTAICSGTASVKAQDEEKKEFKQILKENIEDRSHDLDRAVKAYLDEIKLGRMAPTVELCSLWRDAIRAGPEARESPKERLEFLERSLALRRRNCGCLAT